ncbi:MFS transporter [Sphingosinicella sp. BN140058]|uniref:MFS transporter n=1 Tax=Sphingosinicella sp. BN140058 TaxID=1892855 RepID=UPI0010134979|nr:MFS transporter [Sphingosinicella sp. BN140058]QAY76847.1 MFS transporter [Sphingosinicella sp. BN140058]
MLLYALAYTGLFVAFIPFFSLLLPVKVEAVSAADRVALLSRITLAGALAASISNILFGALSDHTYRRRRTRRPWVLAGLVMLLGAYAVVHLASNGLALVGGVVALQIALNAMFAPVVAIMADEVPDDRKGVMAGLLGIAQPAATLVGVGVTIDAVRGEAAQFALVCLATSLLFLPFLLFAREGADPVPPTPQADGGRFQRLDLALAWAGKLAVQVAGTAVVTYFFFYTSDLLRGEGGPQVRARTIAWIMAAATFAAIPLALGCGRLSDRIGRRKPLLAFAAAGMVAGLLLMASADHWLQAAAGYCTFAATYAVFIALHAAFTMQLLPSPEHRGRDLGIFNLTNTLPNVAGPLLALLLVDGASTFPILWAAAALLCALGGALLMLVRGQK